MPEQEKRAKVIKGLECIAGDVVWCAHCKYSDVNGSGRGDRCKRDCAKDALTLLKAQEPVKPTRYQEGRWFKTWRCGACGGTLVFRNGEDKPKYCTDCGRAVKWE
jgi:hypothetical protein